jgi:glycerol uptake operon antiterminator
MLTVQRFFVIDSMSIRGLQSQLKIGKPDMVEVLPGLMPRVITDVIQITEAPLIASGLIQYKEEVVAALRAGAAAISTTAPAVWEL